MLIHRNYVTNLSENKISMSSKTWLFILKVSTPYFDSFMSFPPKNIREGFLPRNVLIVEKS